MSESLHQRSLLTCILTRRQFVASCFCEISCFAFPDLDDRSLAFPLSTCAKVGWGVGGAFRRYACVGKECWKCAGTLKVGSLWAGGGGAVWYLPLTVDEWASGESDGAQNAPQPPFIFGCTLWVTLSISASPDEPWKTAIGGSGSDVLAENPAIKDRQGCCSDFAPSDPRCIQALGWYDKQDMGRTCFVRPDRSSEYCELCLLFRLTKFSYSQPNTWLPLLSGVEEMLIRCLQQQPRPFDPPFSAFTKTHAFWFDLACLNVPVKKNMPFWSYFPRFKMVQVKPNLQFNLEIANIWVAFLLSTHNHSSS